MLWINVSDIPVEIIPDPLHVTVPPGLSKRGLTRWVCCGLRFQAASATIFACALKVQTPRSLCQKLKFQVNLINLFILHYRILWFALCITIRIGSFVYKISWSISPVSRPWPKWETFALALWFSLSKKNFWGKNLYHEDFINKNVHGHKDKHGWNNQCTYKDRSHASSWNFDYFLLLLY